MMYRFNTFIQKTVIPAKAITIFFLIFISSCTVRHYGFRSPYYSENELIHKAPRDSSTFLKAHLYDGQVFIFDPQWIVDTLTHHIAGQAKIYTAGRKLKDEGYVKLKTDSVAVFESNNLLKIKNNKRIAAKAIITSADVFLGAICLSMPKACFGSCPTFYIDDDSNIMSARAEGFSNAISPKLGYADTDDLRYVSAGGDTLSLIMKNEALETHVVQGLKIMSVAKEGGEHVFQTKKGAFYAGKHVKNLQDVSSLHSDEINNLKYEDGIAYRPAADTQNLVSREEIVLDFGKTAYHRAGLVITFRQSLMTTYMLYHAIGYMGDEYSDFMAKLETSNHLKKRISDVLFEAMGGIEIHIYSDGKWQLCETLYETGPIAHNTLISLIPEQAEKIKLVMNKGLWSIDYIGLATDIREVKALESDILSVEKIESGKSELLDCWTRADDYLVSMPGDKYLVRWVISGKTAQDNALFLEASGYYIEWMRSNWLQDKDLKQLNTLLNNPKKWLRKQTRDYKKYESQMERDFWNSRYLPPQIVENH